MTGIIVFDVNSLKLYRISHPKDMVFRHFKSIVVTFAHHVEKGGLCNFTQRIQRCFPKCTITKD